MMTQTHPTGPPFGDHMLPLRYYAAKDLTNVFETESVGAIRSRARPFLWFHGTADDDMKKRKGAIFVSSSSSGL